MAMSWQLKSAMLSSPILHTVLWPVMPETTLVHLYMKEVPCPKTVLWMDKTITMGLEMMQDKTRPICRMVKAH